MKVARGAVSKTLIYGVEGSRAKPIPSHAPTLSLPPDELGPVSEAPRKGAPGGELVGRRLRHYRIARHIAAGGMGDVYAAVDTSLQRAVAIKTMRAELAQDERLRALFLREAQAQARVVHPHVAQVYFAGEEGGIWFIAMQLLEGGSLADALPAKGRLPWQEAARHMLGVAEGLAEAARVGIVHRDIKPANILLDRSGEAHLADFGLATLASRPPAEAREEGTLPEASVTGVIMGTLDYSAPEQLRGGPVDARADIYSLGATFYHLLSGRPPRSASSLREAVEAHAGPPPRKLRRAARRVPADFCDVIDRCLTADPADRFQDFRELAHALRRAGPQPEVPAAGMARLVAWAIDLAPAAVALRYGYGRYPWGALAALLLVTLVSVWSAGVTPGLWLMRLRLRTVGDGDVSPLRAVLRALFQSGWIYPLGEFLRFTYAGSRQADTWGIVAIAWAAASLLGSLGTLSGVHRALHDRLAGTRVLVDTRAP
jgi:hypothetical protein